PAMAAYRPTSPGPRLPPRPRSKSTPNVLIVEDDSNDVFLLQRAFAAAGFPCSLEIARDGHEAREHLQKLASSTDPTAAPPPCLLILDLKMPRLDGFEFLEWLRQQPNLRRIVTIVLSTSSR